MRRKTAVAALAVLCALSILAFAACKPNNSGGNDVGKVGLTISDMTLTEEESKEISVSVENYDGEAAFAFEAQDKTIVSIEGSTLTALKEGGTSVLCTLVGTEYTATFNVTVVRGDEKTVKITVSDMTLTEEESKEIRVSVENYDGEATFAFEAQDNTVVSIEGSTLTALKEGRTIVLCTLVGTEYTATFNVTVTKKPDLSKITIENMSLKEDETAEIKPVVENFEGEKKFRYEIIEGSEFIKIENGTITALAPGKATVEAALEGSAAKAAFTVEVRAAYKIVFEKQTITLGEGEHEALMPRVVPSLPGADFTYSVLSGADCARVQFGVVTGYSGGTATVRCYLKGDRGVYTDITVVVEAKEPEIPEGYVEIAEGLYAALKAGRYKGVQTVDFITSVKYAKVYYTTDCSPAEEGAANTRKWTGPKQITRTAGSLSDYTLMQQVDGDLNWAGAAKNRSGRYINEIQYGGNYPLIDKAYVYNLAVVKDGEVLSRAITSYILFDANGVDTVPIISLSMPAKKWFDGIGGGRGTSVYNNVYVPGTNVQQDYSARANLEFFDEYGYSFAVNTQVKVGGGWSRGRPQRTLHLNFNKDENGKKQEPVHFEIFGDRTKRGDRETVLDEFTRFRLWNGGSSYDVGLRFNDGYVQLLAEDLNVATSAIKPALVYLNGEFWGMYYLREHYSDAYLNTNYDVKKNDVQYFDYTGGVYHVSDGDEEAANAFIDEMNAYLNNPEKNFVYDDVFNAFFDKYVDEKSMIDCMIVQAWAGNWDFVGNSNNHRVWRVSRVKAGNPYTDGKLRFILHDLDMSIEDRSLGGDCTNLWSIASNWSMAKYNLFSRALANEGFRERLYARVVELTGDRLSPQKTIPVLEKLAAEIRPVVNYNIIRWAQEQSLPQWEAQINRGKNWLRRRNDIFLREIKTTLAICDDKSDSVPITGGNIVYGERVFYVNQYWQENGSLPGCGRKEIRGLSLGDYEVSYRYQVNGIKDGAGQFHIKFIYDGNNYVTRTLQNCYQPAVYTDVKGLSQSITYMGNKLWEGVHFMKFIKRGTTLSVYVDNIFAYDVQVPEKVITGIDVYQHTANAIYRDFVIKSL
ncbi:MAG: CotH kinase family protein [Firmicutes bacterium]|nr:CotH kinase family protein [Bacillota bacterium]MDY5531416.1 CotH kinase family protein [Pumilibacteraceae bacterium]